MDRNALVQMIMSGGKTFAQNVRRDIDASQDPHKARQMQDQAIQDIMNDPMAIAGLTGPVGGASKLLQAQKNLATGEHSMYKGASNMLPTSLNVYDEAGNFVKNTKQYSSLKKAMDIAKNYVELPSGGRAFPQVQQPTYADILIKRIADLKKGGYSTLNAEKALVEELAVKARAR